MVQPTRLPKSSLINPVRLIIVLVSLLVSNPILAASSSPSLHDPTKPTGTPGVEQIDEQMIEDNIYGIRIDATIIAKNNKVAIINGQRLQIGNKTNELTILDIYPDAVKFKDNNNEEITIKVPFSEIKQEVTAPSTNKQ